MVSRQLVGRGIRDPAVLAAMRKVPRHLFVHRSLARLAYADRPLSIGANQTISQPYIVAYMTEVLRLTGSEKVLEIGTGSGYQTAILAELAAEVFSVEIIDVLLDSAGRTLEALGYENIHSSLGDGSLGWPEQAPFDAILAAAAPNEVPEELVAQLGGGGRMVLPVGTWRQQLILVEKTDGGTSQRALCPVRFVAMTGPAGRPPAGRPNERKSR